MREIDLRLIEDTVCEFYKGKQGASGDLAALSAGRRTMKQRSCQKHYGR